MSEPIAIEGIIRCTICGAIWCGKGDDIAPLGSRSISPWDDLACRICDQWGHTVSDLEWYPDVELPEGLNELRWTFDKAAMHIGMLEEAGKLHKFDLWGAINKVREDWEEIVKEKYGDEKRIQWVKDNCDTGYACISNGFHMMAFLAEKGKEFKKVRDKAWWSRELEKDHPVRVKCEAELATWKEKFPDVQVWHDGFTREKYPVTCNDLVYAIPDYEYQENWSRVRGAFYEVGKSNARVHMLLVVKEQIEKNETESISSLVMH